VIGRHGDGGAAVILNRYGEGESLIIGTHPAANPEAREEISKFYQVLLKHAGVERSLQVDNEEILCLVRETEGATLAFLFNLNEEEQTVTLRSGANLSLARDLISGDMLGIKDGCVHVTMLGRGTAVVTLQTRC